jgi:hypothetical protein
MKVFGYEKLESDDEPLLELREVSLQVKSNELVELIEFLQMVRDKMDRLPLPRPGPAQAAHWHLQDWQKHRSEFDADIIVVEDVESRNS